MTDRLPKWARRQVGDEYEGWEDFEEKTAERYGGRKEIASGAKNGRFDVNVRHSLMIDNKATVKSFGVTAGLWASIAKKAKERDQVPMLQVNFSSISEDLVILRRSDFDGYYRASQEAAGG